MTEEHELVKMYGFKDEKEFWTWAQCDIPDIKIHFVEDDPDVGRMPLALITDGDEGLAELSPPEGPVFSPEGFCLKLWNCQWIDLRADLLDRYKEQLEIWEEECDAHTAKVYSMFFDAAK